MSFSARVDCVRELSDELENKTLDNESWWAKIIIIKMQTNLDTKMNTNLLKFKTDMYMFRLYKFRFMTTADLK